MKIGDFLLRRLAEAVFRSVSDLEAAIKHYLEHHNADPRPFIWTAPAAKILEKVARGRQALESVHYRLSRSTPFAVEPIKISSERPFAEVRRRLEATAAALYAPLRVVLACRVVKWRGVKCGAVR